MSTWRVRLEGSPAALEVLPRLLPPTCSVVVEEDGSRCVESAEFENLAEPESVLSVASQAVEAANLVAALHLQGWHPVTCGAVGRLQENGTRRWAKLVSTSVNVSARLAPSPSVVRAGGAVDEPLAPPAFNAAADLVKRSEPLQRALGFLQEGSWASLYNAYEIVCNAVGGEKKVQALGWASSSLASRFRHTSQSPAAIGARARHGVEPTVPPARPLPQSQARALVATLIENWIETTIAQGG